MVTERGNLEAQRETPIRCEVESLSRDASGNYGTQIIFIVPNGSAVKEGDLLVELDSAGLREKLDEQVLRDQKSQSSLVQATARYDNQILQNQTHAGESGTRRRTGRHLAANVQGRGKGHVSPGGG